MSRVAVDRGGVDVVAMGAGPDVVLLHTLLSDRSVWDGVASGLARTRRVWLPNLPGFGGSTRVGPRLEAYAEWLATLFDALGWPPTTDVVANGFGAHVALALAVGHGARFRKLVLAGVAAAFPEAGRQAVRALGEQVRREGARAGADVAVRRTFTEAFIAAHPDLVADRMRRFAAFDAEGVADACMALAVMDFRAALRGVRNPTLVVAGALDPTTTPDLAREVAAGIPGARYVELPECAHCPPLEVPSRFLGLVTEFLAEA